MTGLLTAEVVEPDTANLCVRTVYGYDGSGNKVSATTGNCSGATGRAVVAVRTTTGSFAAQTTSANVNGVAATTAVGSLPTQSSNALGQTETKWYDPRFGTLVGLTGPNGLTTTWQVDDDGRKVREVRADGTSTRVDSCLLPGRVADTSSNGSNCATSVPSEAPGDAVMYAQSMALDAGGNQSGPIGRVYQDRLGREIRSATQSYDGAGQNTGWIVKDTRYNGYGAVAMATQPYFLNSGSSLVAGGSTYGRSMTTYDVLGRPVETRNSDPVGSQGGTGFPDGAVLTASRTSYSYSGYTVAITDDKGRTQTVEKNAIGQTVRTSDPTGAQLASLYDAFGNLVKTVDALQNAIVLTYDTRGRKTGMTDPDSGVWQYDYDALGELVWQQSPNQRNAGQSTTMSYDVLGRIRQRLEPEYISTWTYDRYSDGSACYMGVGKVCEVDTSNGTQRRVNYDGYGRPLQSQLIVTNGPTFTSRVGYDNGTGRVVSQTYPTGLTIGFNFSALGYLQKVVNSAGTMLWQAQSVNAWGIVDNEVVGSGIQTKRVFDGLTGRIAEIDSGPNGGDAPTNNGVMRHRYAYDSLSNLTSRIDDDGNGSGQAVSEQFSYDAVNRLLQYQVAAPAIPNLNRTVDLQYNALGAMLFKTDVGIYNYGAQGAGSVRPHAVASVNGVNYIYDANGNMTVASGGKYSAIAYTSFNLPDSQSGAVGPSNSPRYTWQYDADHQRIREDHSDSTGTRTTWYLHPDNVGGLGFEYEVAANGTQTNRHYLNAGGMTIGVLVTNGAFNSGGAVNVVKTEYWHKDHLGSIAVTTDGNGGVTNRYAYDPFGKRRQTDGNYDAYGTLVADYPTATDRGFTGHEQLDDIGIVHMNGRLYDPNTGHFLQADPFIQAQGNLQSYNRYAYVMNNPLNATDPSGFFSWKGFFKGITLSIISPTPKHLFAATRALPGQVQLDHFVLTHSWAYSVVNIAAAASSFWCGGCVAVYVSSYYTYETTGSMNAAFRSAAITAGTLAASYGVGQIAPVGANATAGEIALNAAGHAAVSCASAVASGGSCAAGALAGGASAAFAPMVKGDLLRGVLVSAVIGGTASVIGGGKFANGALLGSFGYIANSYIHQDGHEYRYNVYVCELSETCTQPTVFQGLLRNDYPGQPYGTVVEDNHQYVVPGGGPIMVTVDAAKFTVVNSTADASHIFCCGSVTQAVLQIDQAILISVYGSGSNTSLAVAFLNYIAGQSFRNTSGIMDYINRKDPNYKSPQSIYP